MGMGVNHFTFLHLTFLSYRTKGLLCVSPEFPAESKFRNENLCSLE